jgi:hypothetical protein
MQNRYVGDIGDFVKFGLLRALSPEYKLGVVWYLVPDEAHNGDGRHIGYLEDGKRRDGKRWRWLDPDLFDSLHRIVNDGERSVVALERENLVPNCQFVSEPLPLPKRFSERHDARVKWLKRAKKKIAGCKLVFLDPDNGLQPERFSPTRGKAIKSVSFEDLASFNEEGRTLIVYHHQTHREGGHIAEIGYNADRLRTNGFGQVDALRSIPYSPRVFFLLNATDTIRTRAEEFAKKWGNDRITWRKNPTEGLIPDL